VIPTYGEIAIFGICNSVKMVPNANAMQVASFFGTQGIQTLMGGTRGRVFEITGMLTGVTPGLIVAGSEALLLSYADGVARTLVDTTGVSWPNVVFRNEYQRDSAGGSQFFWIPALGLWGMSYRCVMAGLT
jgi:hypothetical protein